MKAVVHLLPNPGDISSELGRQMAQAFGATGAFPGGRIPVEVPTGTNLLVEVEGAARSESDAQVVRLLDEKGRERAIFPLHRVDYITFEP